MPANRNTKVGSGVSTKIDDLEELKKSILQKAFAGNCEAPKGWHLLTMGIAHRKTKNKISLKGRNTKIWTVTRLKLYAYRIQHQTP